MAEGSHTFELIGRHLIRAAQPLVAAGSSFGSFKRLMARLGFEANSLPPGYAALAAKVEVALDLVDGFPAEPSLEQILDLLKAAKEVFDAVQALAAAPPPPGADPGAYAAEIGERLFELLLTDYLASEATTAFHLLSVLNVIRTLTVPATPTRPAYVRTEFRWEEIPRIVSSPGDLPTRTYGWGQQSFDAQRVIDDLGRLSVGLRFPVRLRETPDEVMDGYLGALDAGSPPFPATLELPFFYSRVGDQSFEASLVLRPLPAQGGLPPGLILEPRIPSAFPLEIQLHPKVRMRIRAGTNVGSLFGLTIRPGQIGLRYPFAPGTPPPSVGIGFGFDFRPEAPVLLVGGPNVSRLEFGGASLDFGAELSGAGVSLSLGAELRDMKVVVKAGSDGFLRKILGSAQTEVVMPLGLEWSQANGIRFKGSAAFEVALHPHLRLGPVSVDDVDIKLTVPAGAPPRTRLEVGVGISGTLGPFSFMVRGIGLRAEAVFAPGNAGPFGISIGFKPPDGLGLSLNGGGFSGGGFLGHDPAKGEYVGGLELSFQGAIAVRATGILSTRMPDGSEGFSLLLIITGEFPPIQLSFGFTLLGVGGLIGVNRTVLLDQLGLGVRDGSLNSILFPRDVVANASRIIADLKRIFPAEEGHFLIGPMAKLGWGTPTLIHLSLGLILDIPRPMFAVLGVLRMALPAEDLAILNLQVSFVGSVDFESGQLRFDASLFDSRVLTFTLTGDMAVRVYWKNNANFLLTVGGFHPAFTPPPMDLGPIARLGIVIFQGNPNVRAEAYFAVTSNTVQFGARLEAYFGVSAFNVYGFLSLDVLIQFSPFHFVAEIAASLGVRCGSHVLFSIQLELTLEGPGPWRARGTGSFEIGFIVTITIRVHFDVSFGEEQDTRLPPVDVLAEIVKALANLGNWRPRLPAGSHQSVTLRELPDPGHMLVLHPFGALEIAQKLVPLHIAIQRFGSRQPSNGTNFTLTDVRLGGAEAPIGTVQEQFAPAQFFEMTDAEKLSRPSFASYDAGILIGGDLAPRTDFMRTREVTYEVIYLPEHHPFRVRFSLSAELSLFLVRGAAVGQSPLSQNQRAPSPLVERAEVAVERFAVVSADDLTPHAPGLVFDNATAADQALRDLMRASPHLTGSVQVVPAGLMAMAA